MSQDPNLAPEPEPTPDPEPEPAQDPTPAEDPTDWKAEARKWERQSKANKDAADRLKQIEDEKKTETQRLTEDRDTHKGRADKAEAELLRLQVGLDKGLTPAQAKRLAGSTKEELETDADELIATFGGNGSSAEGKPTPRLRGGGDPEEEPDEDLSKVLDDVPRS